jgi:hypothetical protein
MGMKIIVAASGLRREVIRRAAKPVVATRGGPGMIRLDGWGWF